VGEKGDPKGHHWAPRGFRCINAIVLSKLQPGILVDPLPVSEENRLSPAAINQILTRESMV
jgi:hypothetical protein